MSNTEDSNHTHDNQETVNQNDTSIEIEEPVRNYHGQPVPVHVVTSEEESEMDIPFEEGTKI